MDLQTWIAFALASAILLAIPGPTILLVCAYALGAGRRTALWTVLGVSLGDLVAMTASVLGLGALILASSELFTLLRWAGAAYLIYLGVKLWRAQAGIGAIEGRSAGAAGPRMAAHAFAVTATNPKSIVFFIAFTPQFIDQAAPIGPQLVVMVATFVVLAAINAALYAMAAGSLRNRLQNPRTLTLLNRLGASALIGMGLVTALYRRA
jgi:threonine/homoserine/homoserine lactone efflux protein